jgi:hypothetical protein
VDENDSHRATAPARWLLDAGVDGIPLTQTNVLARAVVRDAVERWPQWWDGEIHGPPHREADVRVLELLREGLRRLGLVRRRGRRLFSTARGQGLAQDTDALVSVLASDLGAADEFIEVVADAVTAALLDRDVLDSDELAAAAASLTARNGWCDEQGNAPTATGISWDVIEVLARGDAYGLVERRERAQAPRWRLAYSLTPAGRNEFGARPDAMDGGSTLIFEAELVNAPGVGARLAVGGEQHLTALHDAIQEAFGWFDDHLYSFWLDGAFWGDKGSEYTSPITPDHGVATADVPVAELALAPGAGVAYVFDFGDEWRVMLKVRALEGPGATFPRVIQRIGSAPPQY